MPAGDPLVKSIARIVVGWLFVLGLTDMVLGQERPVSLPTAAIAFVNVNVVPMDRERIDAGQTVLVRGDRIVAIGAAGEMPLPGGTSVIDGAGRYLVPGLTDAHVRLGGTAET